MVWKMSIKLQKMKKEQFAVCGLINVKELDRGPQFTSGVSP